MTMSLSSARPILAAVTPDGPGPDPGPGDFTLLLASGDTVPRASLTCTVGLSSGGGWGGAGGCCTGRDMDPVAGGTITGSFSVGGTRPTAPWCCPTSNVSRGPSAFP